MPTPSSSQGLLPHVDLQVSRIGCVDGRAVVVPGPEPSRLVQVAQMYQQGRVSERYLRDELVGVPEALAAAIERQHRPEDPRVGQLRAEILAEEDRRIFAALDALGEPEPVQALTPNDLQDLRTQIEEARHDPDYRVIENPVFPDISVIPADPAVDPNTRVRSLLEIASNPTIRLADIRTRRFDLIERDPRYRPLVLREMEQIAFLFRRSVWDRLLHDPDDFPEVDPPPERPMSLQERALRDIQDEEDARLFGPPPVRGPIVWHRLGLGEEEGWENS